jgi:hypothetical protein
MGAGVLETPVWYAPLRSPSWLLPAPKADAPSVRFLAERSAGFDGLSDAERDLRLGLPLYLAESTRFLASIRPAVDLTAQQPSTPIGGEGRLVWTAIAPDGARLVRVRIADASSGEILTTIERPAQDGDELGGVLSELPRQVADALRNLGAPTLWDARYSLPPPPLTPILVRGQRTALRLGDPSMHVVADDPDRGARLREQVKAILRPLASAATSTKDTYPAMLFFGALVSAAEAGSDVVQSFRLPANARCMDATDERDPVFRISTLVLRSIGDAGVARQRARRLVTLDDAALLAWLTRVESVR